MKVNRGVPCEEHGLVGTGDVHYLNDSSVEVRLEEDLVAERYEVLRQAHDGWWSDGGGREGWTGRRVQFRDLSLINNDHCHNPGNYRDGQHSKGGGKSLGREGLFGHGGCFLWSVPKGPVA